ncbi:hypothetical protein HS088_TW11G00828 [Tripterygium wilfordii]|uniref:Glycosyltransferase n=1 Tax=Tripterygium wilfordii TaxID=458696 RepID=A0A7J7D332_TRIWF|nr:UDP-glycosyltransferase 72B1-like [Tripterygium wilfordii]KAF5740750.1 hypothetical protein HS088_TW11G00828 [Tripterygium wilfordii]
MAVIETKKPNVAILPGLGMGHITPCLELAKSLVTNHDFQVSFLVIKTNEPSAAQDQLLGSPTLPDNLNIIELPSVDVFAITTNDMPILTRISTILEESLRSLESVLVGLDNPKALVIDLFCSKAFEVCEQLAIPVYSFVSLSVSFLAFSLYFPTLDNEVEGELVDLPRPVQVPGCSPVRTEDLIEPIRNRKIDEYKWFLIHTSRLPRAVGMFVNSWEGLEPVSIQAIREHSFYKDIPAPSVHPVGPLIKQPLIKEKESESLTMSDLKCLTWLDKQPADSVLFVAFGSGGSLTAEQLTELAWGLELSQQRFLLVARLPNDSNVSSMYFKAGSDVNDPKTYLPPSFLERTQELGLVVPSWAPQVMVLRHPSTGGFLSHCGWNSTLESVFHGQPMIAWPLFAEQRMNAAMMEEVVGVAVKPVVELGKRVVGREEIERVVRLVMEGEQGRAMRCKAKELRESAIKALDCGGSSYESLARVVREWI